MNQAFPDLLYNGFLICLDLQLIVLGLIKIATKERRAILLGVFCYILGSIFIYNLWWNDFRVSAFYSILLANYKTLFYGPIIYLYVALLKKNTENKKLLITHLVIPTVVFISYSIIKHVFVEFYSNHYVPIVSSISIIQILLISFYLLAGIDLFRELKLILKPKIALRYFVFYYVLLTYFWGLNAYNLCISFIFKGIEQGTFSFIITYIMGPVSIVMALGVIVFVILETNKLKSLLVEKSIQINHKVVEERHQIEEKVDVAFFKKKLYKNSNLKLSVAASESKVESKLLTAYLQTEYSLSFNDFLNMLRIEEFKRISRDPENRKFTLAGLALQSGFKSKATFHRLFKKKEGITPNEYIKTLEK